MHMGQGYGRKGSSCLQWVDRRRGSSCLQWVHWAGEGGQLLTVGTREQVVAVGVRVFICIRVGAIVQISGP